MTNVAGNTTPARAGTREPDELLVEVRRSILGFALIVSTVIHVVLIGGSSFSLYRDWGKYGFHTPSTINLLKNQELREADDAARKAAAEAKATAAAAFAATNAPAAAVASSAPAGDKGGTTTNTGAIKPPEVQPLPPKNDFTFGEDLKLD